MAFPAGLAVGAVFAQDGISYRVDAVYGPTLYALTQVGGIAPPVAAGTPAITSGDELILHAVKTRGNNVPPLHIAGERHVVGIAPTGAWVNQANMVAESDGLVWSFIDPWPGLHAAIHGTTNIWTWDNTAWVQGELVTNTTATNTVNLTDGVYGDVTVSGAGTIMTVAGGSTTTIINTSASGGGTGVEWYDDAGLGTLTGANQSAVIDRLVSLPRLPTEGRLYVDIEVSGAACRASDLALAVSFDAGNTYATTIDSRIGIPGEDRVLAVGAHSMPFQFDTNDTDERYVWFEIAPTHTGNGRRYEVQIGGYYATTTAGPMVFKIVSAANVPALSTVKVVGLALK